MWSPKKPSARVALSAQRIVIAQPSKGWLSKAMNFEKVDCAPDDGRELWCPAVDALEKWLSVQRQKPALHIYLSARFVRWQLLDWKPEVTQPRELEAYATLRFKETYGKTVEEWKILYSPQPPGHTVPACAINVTLFERLRALGKDGSAHLISVAPYFSSAFDRWSPLLKEKMCWFGVMEADCISLALLRNGRFVGLHSQRVDTPMREALPALLNQIGIALGVTDATVPIYLVGDRDVSALPSGMPFQWLQSWAPKEQAPAQLGMRMALGM